MTPIPTKSLLDLCKNGFFWLLAVPKGTSARSDNDCEDRLLVGWVGLSLLAVNSASSTPESAPSAISTGLGIDSSLINFPVTP
jgi:hypothetical protein